MILIDSNILVYAINTSSPKHQKAQQYLLEQQGNSVYFHQNILESLRVLTHPKYPSPMPLQEAYQALHLITQNESILSPSSETYSIVQELISRFPGGGNQIFDLYLVATMLSHNIQTIATDNQKHFQLFHGITITNPFT